VSTPSATPVADPVDNPRTAAAPVAAMDAAKAPVGPGTISVVGLVLALLLTALGAVAIRDALVIARFLHGTPWTAQAGGRSTDSFPPHGWSRSVLLSCFSGCGCS